MTATYSISLATAKDRIRLQLGDTDTAHAVLADETIAAILTLKSSDEAAALVMCAQASIAVIGREPVKVEADGASFDFSDRLKALNTILARADAALTTTPTQGTRIRRLNKPQNIEDQGEYTT